MKSKKILYLFLSFIMTLTISFVAILPIFAITSDSLITTQPADLGEYISSTYGPANDMSLQKYYLYIDTSNKADDTYSISCIKYDDYNVVSFYSLTNITISNNILTLTSNNYYSKYSIIVSPNVTIDITNINELWIPCFALNGGMYSNNLTQVKFYKSTITDNTELMRQYYEIGYFDGYNSGYEQGLTDYPGARDDWNLVQHIQHAIGFFIGDEYAQYVTPFAIAFTILMAYFIFIRWIFLFGKSQKALRVADIVVIVACICVMAVMYINMLTINIQNTNITESVESSSEVIRSIIPNNVYKYVDDIKIDSVYKIVDDVRIGG